MLTIAVLSTASAASAFSFSFTQSGFAEGATISGTFSGTELGFDGKISDFNGEVTSMTLHFSGNSTVGAFTHNLSDVFGFVYLLGSNVLDDFGEFVGEGIRTETPTHVYSVGVGSLSYPHEATFLKSADGFVFDLQTGLFDTSTELVQVVPLPIPEPATALLVAVGLTGFALRRRTLQR